MRGQAKSYSVEKPSRSSIEESRNRRFDGLEFGRGLAALAVLLSHVSIILAEPRFYGSPIFNGVFTKFGAGVDFFFVLSGFIITWVHWHDIGHPDQVRRYAKRRILRIYPPYWGVLLPLSLGYFLVPGMGTASQRDPVNFLCSLLLLPYPELPILGVAWTLVYEMSFYALFAIVISVGRKIYWLMAAWALLIVLAHVAFPPLSFPLSFLLNAHNLEFLMGVAAAEFLRRYVLPAPRAFAIAGLALFVAQLLIQHPMLDDPLVGRIGFGVSACMAVAGLVEWQRQFGLRVPWTFTKLGSASYAIYLSHVVAIMIGVQIFAAAGVFDRLGIVAAFLLIAAFAVIAGIAYHELFEKPLSRLLGGWRPRQAPMALRRKQPAEDR